MTDLALTTAVLTDSFDRIRDLAADLTSGLTSEASTYRLDTGANPIGWLLWHLTRIQDDHIADLAGREQIWPTWRERFALPFDDFATGHGQSSADVAAVGVEARLLAGYHAEVDAMTRHYLTELTAEELVRVVDTRWDPPVTVSVRLVSVISDCLQHLGQAALVKGVAQRSGLTG